MENISYKNDFEKVLYSKCSNLSFAAMEVMQTS